MLNRSYSTNSAYKPREEGFGKYWRRIGISRAFPAYRTNMIGWICYPWQLLHLYTTWNENAASSRYWWDNIYLMLKCVNVFISGSLRRKYPTALRPVTNISVFSLCEAYKHILWGGGGALEKRPIGRNSENWNEILKLSRNLVLMIRFGACCLNTFHSTTMLHLFSQNALSTSPELPET